MKQIVFTLLFSAAFLTSSALFGQIRTPSASPSCKMEQTVGVTQVTLEYSRPGVKDRTIFGGLVPYDEVWRTGANAATKITFSDDVVFGGQELKAGSYAILTVPGKTEWTFKLYPYESWDFSSYIEKEPAAKIKSEPVDMPFSVETMTFFLGELRDNSATLYLIWDMTSVPVSLKVPTEEIAMASIDEVMAGPSQNELYASANYYLNNGKDLNKALKWVNKSIEMGYEQYWVYRTKALIQAGLGNKKEAITSAKRSSELAKEAGNEGMVKENETSIKMWMASN
jgi:hypothetical protein